MTERIMFEVNGRDKAVIWVYDSLAYPLFCFRVASLSDRKLPFLGILLGDDETSALSASRLEMSADLALGAGVFCTEDSRRFRSESKGILHSLRLSLISNRELRAVTKLICQVMSEKNIPFWRLVYSQCQ